MFKNTDCRILICKYFNNINILSIEDTLDASFSAERYDSIIQQ